ncbi:MAG: YaiI/YqxD family protein [Planctomycetes bacterium]|nr:YaiI/YqxD family protein [Planctomycetota bacterium]
MSTKIYVDADACPVKSEVYRVAQRYRLAVMLVANSWMRAPSHDRLELVVVENQFDGADDWIAAHAGEDDIVITADIQLAARCLEKGARPVDPRGRAFEEETIAQQLAMRELFSHLRDLNPWSGKGPPPFGPRDRSRFLQSLDQTVQDILRGR